jgi:hypothetical protein
VDGAQQWSRDDACGEEVTAQRKQGMAEGMMGEKGGEREEERGNDVKGGGGGGGWRKRGGGWGGRRRLSKWERAPPSHEHTNMRGPEEE